MEANNDGFLSWGRWTGDVLVNGTPVTLTANQGLHYVTGIPTPAASMPTGGTFTYNLIGATSPTFANGLTAPGVLNSASLTGDFTSGSSNVSVSLSATAGGSTYSGTAGGPISGALFAASGTVTTGNCSGACGLGVSGFFSGVGASHAGIVYQFTGVQFGATSLNGAAALAR